jgi:hypothetical protein
MWRLKQEIKEVFDDEKTRENLILGGGHFLFAGYEPRICRNIMYAL